MKVAFLYIVLCHKHYLINREKHGKNVSLHGMWLGIHKDDSEQHNADTNQKLER